MSNLNTLLCIVQFRAKFTTTSMTSITKKLNNFQFQEWILPSTSIRAIFTSSCRINSTKDIQPDLRERQWPQPQRKWLTFTSKSNLNISSSPARHSVSVFSHQFTITLPQRQIEVLMPSESLKLTLVSVAKIWLAAINHANF